VARYGKIIGRVQLTDTIARLPAEVLELDATISEQTPVAKLIEMSSDSPEAERLINSQPVNLYFGSGSKRPATSLAKAPPKASRRGRSPQAPRP
jgi:hypothetical protein